MPDRIPGALFHLRIPLPLAVGGGPPRFEQIVGFLVQQLRIKILENQLHHGLPQFLITGEIEDDVQAGMSQDIWTHYWIEGRQSGFFGIAVNVIAFQA